MSIFKFFRGGNNKNDTIASGYINKYLATKSRGDIIIIENFLYHQHKYRGDSSNIQYVIWKSEKEIENVLNLLSTVIQSKERESNKAVTIQEKKGIRSTIEIAEMQINFISDLRMLKRVCQSNDIKVHYHNLIDDICDCIQEDVSTFQDRNFMGLIKKSNSTSMNKYQFTYYLSNIDFSPEEFSYIYSPIALKSILNKFGYKVTIAEYFDVLEKVDEIGELETFRSKLDGRRTALISPNRTEALEDIDGLDGIQFENFLADRFRSAGFNVMLTPPTRDQGADLLLTTDGGGSIVVQAKRYAGKVSNKAVQEIAAAKNYYQAEQAIVVTTGYFTQSAVDLAKANDVTLWDRNELIDFIRKSSE